MKKFLSCLSVIFTLLIIMTLSVSAFTYGDVNDDGKVGVGDIVLMAQKLADFSDISINEAAADVTCDDDFDIRDIVLLAQHIAGWNVSLGASNGGRLDFPELTYLYNDSYSHYVIGENIKNSFAVAGISMELEAQDWNTFLNTRKNGYYQLARNGWLADYNDPICFLDMWTSESGNNDAQFGRGAHANIAAYDLDLTPYGGENIVGGTWAETYDVLISMIKTCKDKEARYEMMHLAEDLLMETGCIVPLYYYTDIYMLDSSVDGFFSTPLGYKYFTGCTVDGKTDSISVALSSEPSTLDPAHNSAVDGATLISHLFSGLAKWSVDEEGKLMIVPDAAKELTEGVQNDDGTVTYTYTLKEGLKWSDGVAVKASDFEFAWKRAAHPDTWADYGYMFEVICGYGSEDFDGLAVTSDDEARTLTVTLKSDVPYWNELLAFTTYYPVRADVVENENWASDPSTYVCNGPYTITSWEHDSLIVLEKNPMNDTATMEKIEFALIDNAADMLYGFENGDLMLIDDVPGDRINELKAEYPDEFITAGQLGTYYFLWNVNYDMLPSDSELSGAEAEKARAEIRRALSAVIDRSHLVNDVLGGGVAEASSFVPMSMTDSDGGQFYMNAGNGDGYIGYYDVSSEAHKGYVSDATSVLAKYFG